MVERRLPLVALHMWKPRAGLSLSRLTFCESDQCVSVQSNISPFINGLNGSEFNLIGTGLAVAEQKKRRGKRERLMRMEHKEAAYIITVAFTCTQLSLAQRPQHLITCRHVTDTCHDLWVPLERCAVLKRSGWGYRSRRGRGHVHVH